MGIFGRLLGRGSASTTSFTGRAIAYLKAVVSPDDAAIELPWEDSPVMRPFAEGLLVTYLVDTGNRYEYVQNRHLAQEGANDEQLHHTGLANLRALAETRRANVEVHGNVFAVLMRGDFEASLLLLDDLWDQQFRQFVEGDYAIAIPGRDVLAFCDASSSAGLDELRQVIAGVYPSGDHLVSDRLYRRRDRAWAPLAGN